MATSVLSRGSSMASIILKISPIGRAVHPVPAISSISGRRFFSQSATAFQREHEKSGEPQESSVPFVRTGVPLTVSNVQDISNLERVEKCFNKCQLMGRVGSEPQLRGTEKHPVLLFSLATHTQYRDVSGNLQQKTFWHRVAIFKSGLRETSFKFLRKGSRVFLTGEIQYNDVKDPETNYVRSVTSIVADDLVMLASPAASKDAA